MTSWWESSDVQTLPHTVGTCLFNVVFLISSPEHSVLCPTLLHQQIACENARVYSFYPVVTSLGQNICLQKIFDEFVTGSLWVKN